MVPTPTFTDAQIAVILHMAQPLLPDDRPAFFEAVVASLQGVEIGDGVVCRACAAAQSRFRSLGVGSDG